ncbi:hypothetical protein BKA70DRAFT_1116022 [Coprinopsis sp. MPI-PUGE-AT-0042]|nr:hypothetical protein BKA70DRAFT_1116022 [Coprinopsis sp. MPI-PUGE-AT-0042]
MSDLTVLVSPTPMIPQTRGLFGRRQSQFSRPIMVTLESEPDSTQDSATLKSAAGVSETAARRGRPSRDTALLSPPINTWKSPRPRHRPTRSQSAPPGGIRLEKHQDSAEQQEAKRKSFELSEAILNRPPVRPLKSFNSSFSNTPRPGELLRPPPPLFRPTTFWRKTRKSGVTSASYSPSTHLVRRSTYIAAGLSFDAPGHDLSALGVESRVGFLVIPPEHDILP